jgi:hypothetical protein
LRGEVMRSTSIVALDATGMPSAEDDDDDDPDKIADAAAVEAVAAVMECRVGTSAMLGLSAATG